MGINVQQNQYFATGGTAAPPRLSLEAKLPKTPRARTFNEGMTVPASKAFKVGTLPGAARLELLNRFTKLADTTNGDDTESENEPSTCTKPSRMPKKTRRQGKSNAELRKEIKDSNELECEPCCGGMKLESNRREIDADTGLKMKQLDESVDEMKGMREQAERFMAKHEAQISKEAYKPYTFACM